ncbi:MAG: type II toxin-antitoxin system PemK/MazF family toxin [Cyanobacteria bacterium J06621_8]
MNNHKLKEGQIRSVFCPFSNQRKQANSLDVAGKERPAIIIKILEHDIWVLEITKSCRGTKYEVKVDQCDLKIGNLPYLSYVRLDKIHTISKEAVGREYGVVRFKKITEIKDRFFALLEQKTEDSTSKSKTFQRPSKPQS